MKTRSSNKKREKEKKNIVNGACKQLVVRFPQDVADHIHSSINDSKINVEFISENHAKVTVFDETFNAILVGLPTIVETFRTNDGVNLFKSGEIQDLLLVYRGESIPSGVSPNFEFSHGITPPTTDIIMKRRLKEEAIAYSTGDVYLEGVDYWELAELQIAESIGKKKCLSKYQREEIMEEPDIDPVILEKFLRKNGYPELIGYSGKYISQEEVDAFDMNAEDLNRLCDSTLADSEDDQSDEIEYIYSNNNSYPFIIDNPNNGIHNILNKHQKSAKREKNKGHADKNGGFLKKEIMDNLNDDDKEKTEMENVSDFDFGSISSEIDDNTTEKTESVSMDEKNTENDRSEEEEMGNQSFTQKTTFNYFDDDEDEDEEEESVEAAEMRKIRTRMETLVAQREVCKRQLMEKSENAIIRSKIENHLISIEKNIEEVSKRIKEFDTS